MSDRIPLTDDELQALAVTLQRDPALLAKLTSDERRRLRRVQVVAPTVTPPPRTWTDTAVDALPTIGGAAGGVVGGIGGTIGGVGVGGVPGAVLGAGVGGWTGEALRQGINALRGAPQAQMTVGQQLAGMGTQGATQAASELIGQGVMKGAAMAGRGLMDFAIRPAPTVAEEFGDIAGTAIKERIPVGSLIPGGTTGSQLANAARRESTATTRGLLTNAEQAGTLFRPADLARKPVRTLIDDIAKQPVSESELNHVTRLLSDYINEHPSVMTPNAVKDMKTAAQRIAKPIFKALNSGNVPAAGEAVKAQFNKAIADGAKETLEQIPGVAASEARTQGLIGLARAVRRAEVRRMPLMAEMAAPIAGAAAGGIVGGKEGAGAGVGTALVVRALLSPRTTSRTALALTQPQIQQALRHMPRAAVYALLDKVTARGERSE